MTHPGSSSGKHAPRPHRHHHHRMPEAEHRRTERVISPQQAMAPANMAATSMPVASPIDERIHPSEDTLTLAAAVAASIPAAPLAPAPAVAVPVAQVSPTQTPAPAAALETAQAQAETGAAPLERRGILQRLFGWN
ncbi:serine/threonine-protein kinase NLK [Drosophila obscura]|uniref:serine/threonine-protein kinase NLK n=1 Tax=Drosophila obscura TaxID=7282 RepID=UPI000BA0072A|nr:serine/threonine-protein kinase NLK [Drosophila obscura]